MLYKRGTALAPYTRSTDGSGGESVNGMHKKPHERNNYSDVSKKLYADLHRIAERLMAGEHAGHTLQVTALVNEAWLRMNQKSEIQAEDRQHLKAIAARQMRHALIDHARRNNADKSPYNRLRVSLDNKELIIGDVGTDEALDLIDLCQSLEALARLNSRHCQVFELRYFGGQTVIECSNYLGVSERTVKQDWQFATAWLAQRLGLEPAINQPAGFRAN